MTELTSMSADERRRIIDDYLDAVFADDDSPVADELRAGAAELPEDPTAHRVAAWLELVELLRDPDHIASSRRMAERIETFTDRRVARYWALVGIVNGWPQAQARHADELVEAWEWYAKALRAHTGSRR